MLWHAILEHISLLRVVCEGSRNLFAYEPLRLWGSSTILWFFIQMQFSCDTPWRSFTGPARNAHIRHMGNTRYNESCSNVRYKECQKGLKPNRSYNWLEEILDIALVNQSLGVRHRSKCARWCCANSSTSCAAQPTKGKSKRHLHWWW